MGSKKRKKSKNAKHIDNKILSKNNPQGFGKKYISAVGLIIILVVVVVWLNKDSISSTFSETDSHQNEMVSTTTDSNQKTLSGPTIHFPESSHDFGTIPQGAKVSHTFIVKNTGNEPLKLIKAKGS